MTITSSYFSLAKSTLYTTKRSKNGEHTSALPTVKRTRTQNKLGNCSNLDQWQNCGKNVQQWDRPKHWIDSNLSAVGHLAPLESDVDSSDTFVFIIYCQCNSTRDQFIRIFYPAVLWRINDFPYVVNLEHDLYKYLDVINNTFWEFVNSLLNTSYFWLYSRLTNKYKSWGNFPPT